MKLFFSPTSPYVRKVMVTLYEIGCRDHVEVMEVNPWDPAAGVDRVNPLGKVPVLVTAEGMALYDSPVICEYLDALNGNRLLPAAGPRRWELLRLQALADGVMDAAIQVFLELNRRAQESRSDWWLEVQYRAIDLSIAQLEQLASGFQDAPDCGTIAAGCALGYLDLRLGERNWRSEAPTLADWYAQFSQRDSMVATAPPAG